MKLSTFLSMCVVATLAVTASAQSRFDDLSRLGGGYHHASTAAEGFQRGMADVVRSAGAANVMNSEAAINYEAARSQNIENHLQYTQTYFEMKQVNKAYKDANRRPPATSEQLMRWNKQREPNRLSPSEVDPLSGQIAWPSIIEQPEYDTQREQLETLFAERAGTAGSRGSDHYYGQIRSTANEMLALLQKNIKDYPPQQYMQAKKFVTSLAHEGSFPTS